MRLIEEMDRSNSRLNNRSSLKPGSRQNNGSAMGYGDEQDTVKNSMINLLNVIENSGKPNIRQDDYNPFRHVS